MVKRTGPMSTVTLNVMHQVGKLGKKSRFWERVRYELSKPARQMCQVSIAKINTYTGADETVLVPGKVLSDGELGHKVTVAALSFSALAKEKISKYGKAITISQLAKDNPNGKKVRLMA